MIIYTLCDKIKLILFIGDSMTEIEKKIEELRKTLRYHSDRYYNDDAPEIEDYEYDMMMRELKELEEKYPEYDAPDSPTKKVIGGVADNSFESVAHSVKWKVCRTLFQRTSFANSVTE